MKTPLVIALSSALTTTAILAGVGIYSITQQNSGSVVAPTPIATVPAPVAPSAPANPNASGSPTPIITWTQAENDYLYDLAQALQPQERNRTTPAEKLAIGRKIQGWLDSGADYWSIREKFDTAYQGTILDNYNHNRDVYIRFATERFATSHLDTLTPPPQVVEVPVEVPVYPDRDDDRGNNRGDGQDNNQGNGREDSTQPEPFDGGVAIAEREATVIEAGSLNCRAIPNGQIVSKVYEKDVILVNRAAGNRADKMWYFIPQKGCWVFGGGIQLKSMITNPEPSPMPGQSATVTASGTLNCRATPTGKVVDRFASGDVIRVTKVDHGSGAAWYLTEKGCWVAGQYIQLDRVR